MCVNYTTILYGLFCFRRLKSHLNYCMQNIFLFIILPISPVQKLALFLPLGFPTCILMCREIFVDLLVVILVQLIIFLCTSTSFMCNQCSKTFLVISVTHSITAICVFHFLLHYAGNICFSLSLFFKPLPSLSNRMYSIPTLYISFIRLMKYTNLSFIRLITHCCKWVSLTTAWCILRLQMEEWLPIWRVAANILNKQSRAADRGWPSSLGVGQDANNSSP